MNHQETADRFLAWCNSFGPTFHNSPDIINLKFWAGEHARIVLTAEDKHAILSLVRYGSTPEEHNNENDTEVDDMTRKRDAKGKPAASILTKVLDLQTRQGQIVQFILDISTNINDVCAHFAIERHSLLTQLNVIARTTGIGYSVTSDIVLLELPEGVVDPFDESEVIDIFA